MIYSRQYSRQIIVLKSVDSTKANGRCVIEIKNSSARLIVNTYNLQAENIYGVYFVMKSRNNEAVKMGDLVSERQKSISFSPDDIEGNKLENVSAVAIVKQGSKMPALAGYTDDYVDLKAGITIRKNTDNRMPKADSIIPNISTVNDKNIKENEEMKIAAVSGKSKSAANSSADSSDNTAAKKIPPHIDFMEMFNKFRKDMEELEKMAFSAELPQCGCEKCQNENSENKSENQRHENEAPSADENTENTENIENIENNELPEEQYSDNKDVQEKSPRELLNYSDYIRTAKNSVNPFENKTGNINWYEIMPRELSPIEEIPIQIILSPYVISSYIKYGHIILGMYDENGNEKYIVGIPCEKNDECKTKYFKQFIPISKENSAGYRLCYL